MWDSMGNSKKKAKGMARTENQIDGILGGLNSLLRDLSKSASAEQKTMLLPKLAEVKRQTQLLEKCCEQQSSESDSLPLPARRRTTPLPSYTTHFVGTLEAVKTLVDTIAADAAEENGEATTIYVDSEGPDLGRDGDISLLQMFLVTGAENTMPDGSSSPEKPVGKVWLVDIFTLKETAFSTAGAYSKTLRDLLQSKSIRKIFWDCRADIEALYHLCNIRMDPDSVVDVQLLDYATIERNPRGKLSSLDQAVRARINLDAADTGLWKRMKTDGKKVYQRGPNWEQKELQDRAKGWDYFVASNGYQPIAEPTKPIDHAAVNDGWEMAKAWERRPIHPDMIQYAAGDVVVLEPLLKHLENHERLTKWYIAEMSIQISKRIADAQSSERVARSNKGPEGWR